LNYAFLKPLLLLTAGCLLLGGCGLPAGTQDPSEVVSAPPAAEETPAEQTAQAPEVTEGVESAETPDLPVSGIAEQGPWLMILTPDGLWAPNSDYSDARQLTFQHLLAPQDITVMPSPTGGYLAYITGEQLTQNLTLHLYVLPRGLAQTLPLVSPQYQPPPENTVAGDPAFEAVRAIFEATSLGWSADGRQLAFSAVLDSDNADLYLLNAETFFSTGESVVKITSEAGQAIDPLWSPDGEWIVYLEAADLGIGAGKNLAAVRVVAPATGENRLLYAPDAGRDERIVGWVGDRRLAVHSREVDCGSMELRTIHLGNGEVRSLWATPFNGAAFDPGSRMFLVTVDQFAATCAGAEGFAGLFLVSASGAEPLHLASDEAFLPIWSPEAGMFFARTSDRVLGVRPDGEVIDLMAPQPVLPLASQDGLRLAWATHTGLWLADLGSSPASVFEGPVFGLAWTPAGNLVFFSEDRMYLASPPEFNPTLIREGVINRGLIWVWP
jgi:hypothetical protein